MFQDTTTVNHVQDTVFVPLYLQKNPQDISADSNSNMNFDKYVINILNDSFPLPQQRQSLFTDKSFVYQKSMPMQKRTDTNNNADWIFGVLVLIIFIVALMMKFANSNLFELLKGCFSKQQLEITVKDGTKINFFSLIPVFFVFIPIFSFLIFCICNYYEVAVYNFKGYILYLIIFGILVVFYLLKMFFIRFFGSVFRGKKISLFYIQIQLNFNFLMGFLLIIPVILAIYAGNFYEEIFIFISLFLIVSLYVVKIIRSFYVIIKTFKFSRFYLFFYLCTIELLPILLIGKVLFFK